VCIPVQLSPFKQRVSCLCCIGSPCPMGREQAEAWVHMLAWPLPNLQPWLHQNDSIYVWASPRRECEWQASGMVQQPPAAVMFMCERPMPERHFLSSDTSQFQGCVARPMFGRVHVSRVTAADGCQATAAFKVVGFERIGGLVPHQAAVQQFIVLVRFIECRVTSTYNDVALVLGEDCVARVVIMIPFCRLLRTFRQRTYCCSYKKQRAPTCHAIQVACS
jgi:hypothetical protein